MRARTFVIWTLLIGALACDVSAIRTGAAESPEESRRLSLSWPLRGPVSSRFGERRARSSHSGIDIAADPRAPIHAAADGTVVRVADNPRYGLMVVIEHGGGYTTWYGHTSALVVGKGDTVRRGQVIALVGETGNARGAHLHFELRRRGVPVDPLPFMEPVRASPRPGSR